MSSAAAAHLRELAERKSKVYELLLSLEQNPSADESCFQSLARVVDRLQFNEISLDNAALRDLSAWVGAAGPELSAALAVLDVASSEAEPDRKNLQLLLTRFPAWISSASEAAQPLVLEILPNIAAHLNELGNAGVEALIADFERCASAEDRDRLARAVVRYQETSGEIISASAEDRRPADRSRSGRHDRADADGCAAGGDVRFKARPGTASGHRRIKHQGCG